MFKGKKKSVLRELFNGLVLIILVDVLFMFIRVIWLNPCRDTLVGSVNGYTCDIANVISYSVSVFIDNFLLLLAFMIVGIIPLAIFFYPLLTHLYKRK